KSVAGRTPVQGSGGRGGRHRRSPRGGAANGMPQNCRTPSFSNPSTRPQRVSTTSVFMQDHAADVPSLQEVLVALVDLLQLVAARDQLVLLQVSRPVEPDQPRDFVHRVGGAEDDAREAL